MSSDALFCGLGCAPDRSRMQRLVETQVATAGQANRRLDPPRRFFNGRKSHTVLLQRGHRLSQVVAHQVNDRTQHGPAAVLKEVLVFRGMNGGLGRWEGEDEPAFAN